MAARRANTLITATQNQSALPATSLRSQTSRAVVLPYERSALLKRSTGRQQRLRAPPIDDVSKLEAAYIGRQSQFTIALPVDEGECLKRVRLYSYASLYAKGSHSARKIQHATGNNSLTAQEIHHALWVGRQWNAILNLFDSIVKELGKWSPNFKPHGLMFLLKTSYW